MLNDEDKQQSYRQLEAHHADQLDDILARIQDIERQEDSMIQQGLALSYDIPGTKCDLPTALRHEDASCARTQSNGTDLQHLRLPLEVVMNINIPDNTTPTQELREIIAPTTSQNEDFDRDELSAQQALIGNPVKTSILEGKRLQSIERRRHKFQHHRRLVESSLAETGMAQFAVIEMWVYTSRESFSSRQLTCSMYPCSLEEMLLDDLVEQTAAELSDTVLSMSDTLLINLL